MNSQIVIIDSGYDCGNMKGYCLQDSDNGCEQTNNLQDHIGHGTMVTNIIRQNTVNANLYMIKIFNEEEEITSEKLINALEYVYGNLDPDIINLSLGISFCPDIPKLKEICDKIVERGTIIVAAFDNIGSISYPAAFPNVIGVDSVKECINTRDYYYVINSPINIQAIGIVQRLKGIGDEYYNVTGSSFVAPYITAKISNILSKNNHRIELTQIMELLRIDATKEIIMPKLQEVRKPFTIKKAIMFPFNKEIETLAISNDLLNFEIVGIYDLKYLKNLGRKISFSNGKSLVIESINKIQWEDDFDTVIIGHSGELTRMMKKNIIRELACIALEHGKQIYTFDDFCKIKCLNPEKVFIPEVNKENIPYCNNGKLRQVCVPILCVAGTSSKQGKFSLQLSLKKRMETKGYKIGHLATEPTGYLLGADIVFPMGYSSTVHIEDINDFMTTANNLIGSIEDKKVDLIITGLQSQTLPMTYSYSRDLMIYNHAYLVATNPDAIILCVNVIDSLEYIERTIYYLSNVVKCKVLSIVIFPIKKNINWNVIGSLSVREDETTLQNTKRNLEQKFNIRTLILDDDNDMDTLCDTCISYFTE